MDEKNVDLLILLEALLEFWNKQAALYETACRTSS